MALESCYVYLLVDACCFSLVPGLGVRAHFAHYSVNGTSKEATRQLCEGDPSFLIACLRMELESFDAWLSIHRSFSQRNNTFAKIQERISFVSKSAAAATTIF